MKIPIRMYSLKKLYEKAGMNFISTCELKELGITKAHMYELRGDLEFYIWHKNLTNRDNSKVYARGSMKIGNFWRISAKGLLSLYTYFDLADENLKEVTKKLLLGENL
jgi:hypothetical protein